MNVNDRFLAKFSFQIHSGSKVIIWEDIRIGDKSLIIVYPSLYNIVRKKEAKVAEVLSTTPMFHSDGH